MTDDTLAMIAASAMREELSMTIMMNLLVARRKSLCSLNVLCRTVVSRIDITRYVELRFARPSTPLKVQLNRSSEAKIGHRSTTAHSWEKLGSPVTGRKHQRICVNI